MTKKIFAVLVSTATFFIFALPVSAHVIVKPNQVGIAAFQEFSMSVPSERDNPTVDIRLTIPKGLTSVVPNVKPGWTITEKKTGSGDDAVVTEIDWSGGSIPAGQRDDFLFQAQAPATETTLDWKAYQTYQDGTVISWDHDPKLSKGPDDDSAPPPYSTTQVINDLKPASQTAPMTDTTSSNVMWALLLSGISIIFSASALGLVFRKK